MTYISTPDGRQLRIQESGDPTGLPVVVHHGTPGSCLPYAPWAEEAMAQGLRLISYDRPGYGESTRALSRSVAGAAADVEAIADFLGMQRFATMGMSGGGPHALACAELLPDRVVAVAALASVAPFDAAGLDFLSGMGELNVQEFRTALDGIDPLEQFLRSAIDEMLQADAAAMIEGLRTLLSPEDAAVLDRELAEYLLDSMRDGVRPGPGGWVDDDTAFVSPWGFDPSTIRVPALVWQGERDFFVPPAHGRWLITQIAGVDGRLTAEDGHLTLAVRRIREVQAWLRSRF
jgi:pimeloyl-ACP methyl ester carboxylesterase